MSPQVQKFINNLRLILPEAQDLKTSLLSKTPDDAEKYINND